MSVPGTPRQRKALLLLLLSAVVSIVWSLGIARNSYSGMGAFKAIFYGTRCLMQHRDPYNPAVLQQVYRSEGGSFPSNPADASFFRRSMLICVNLPTSLFLIAPFALLPWRLAALLWMGLNAASLILAAWLIWRIAGRIALKPATLLIGLVLVNSELVLSTGNLAAVVTGLCIVAAWCFVEERFLFVGAVCLAIGLLCKPHDAGLVWLYFLLAGGARRKGAVEALGVVVALALPAMLWNFHAAPHWPQELRANMATLAAHGSVNDPGPDAMTFHSPDPVICLQSPLSLIRDDPRFYNLASYAVCGLLLLTGAVRTLRVPFTRRNAWLALAAIAPLSMLPVYHRTYDAKLLLLAVPACAMLWREGGPRKWLAGVLTTLAIACTSDVPVVFLLTLMNGMKNSRLESPQGKLLTAFVFHPAALALLAMGLFYLWAYVERSRRFAPSPEGGAEDCNG